MMRSLIRSIALFLLVFCVSASYAQQQKCPYDVTSKKDADNIAKGLEDASSCKDSIALLNTCMTEATPHAWSTGYDAWFTSVTNKKCAGTFYDKLSESEKYNYHVELDLCSYEYVRRPNPRAMVLCHVNTTAIYADNPKLADKSLPQASFDCAHKESPLEKAVCSNQRLGETDIILSRVYGRAMKRYDQKTAAKTSLVADEKRWMDGLPAQCDVSGHKSVDCLRNEYEIRFTALDNCTTKDDEVAACLQSETDVLRKQKAPPASTTIVRPIMPSRY